MVTKKILLAALSLSLASCTVLAKDFIYKAQVSSNGLKVRVDPFFAKNRIYSIQKGTEVKVYKEIFTVRKNSNKKIIDKWCKISDKNPRYVFCKHLAPDRKNLAKTNNVMPVKLSKSKVATTPVAKAAVSKSYKLTTTDSDYLIKIIVKLTDEVNRLTKEVNKLKGIYNEKATNTIN